MMQHHRWDPPLPPASLAEKFVVCCTLIMLCNTFPPGFFTPEVGLHQGRPAGSLEYQAILAALYVACLVFFAMHIASCRASLRLDPALMLVVLACLLSVAWSYSPSGTLIRSLGLVGTTLVGIYLGKRFALKDILKILWVACAICVVASIFVIIAFPSYGIVGDKYAIGYMRMYRGVFDNKNALSSTCIIAFLTFVYALFIFRGTFTRILSLTLVMASAVLIIVAQAATSYFIVVLLCLGIAAAVIAGKAKVMRFPVIVAGIWLCVAIAAAMFYFIDVITASVGRDPTLTNRTLLWSFAWQMIELRPLLGYGYGVFWDTVGLPMSAIHAHNGYLNVLLDVGLIGAVPLLFLLLGTLRKSMAEVFRSPTWPATWRLAIVFVILLSNLSEVTFLSAYSLQWCLFVAVATMHGERREWVARVQPAETLQARALGEH